MKKWIPFLSSFAMFLTVLAETASTRSWLALEEPNLPEELKK